MSITYTNHFKAVYDQIKTFLIAEFPRLVNKDRILFKPIESINLGLEDVVFIRPLVDNEEYEDTAGRTSTFIIELTYLIKIQPQVNYDRITDMGEHVKKLFGAGNYRYNTTYWHYCNVLSIDYNPELPEEIKDTYGFVMTLEIHKSQY